MHTLYVLLGGFGLLALCVLIGLGTSSRARGALLFVPIWFLIAAANMMIGVNAAGYTYTQEFPIFILVFGLPAIAALWLWRKWR